mmetsp:Transcript_31613/g.69458  ORF Transcript_31613/g.69458 Transcript_31613/m.69458 type:complete len:97 (+) Transcript_31613:2368-2658(+)
MRILLSVLAAAAARTVSTSLHVGLCKLPMLEPERDWALSVGSRTGLGMLLEGIVAAMGGPAVPGLVVVAVAKTELASVPGAGCVHADNTCCVAADT